MKQVYVCLVMGLLWVVAGPSVAAQAALRVNVLAVDASNFPEIVLDIQVEDAQGRRLLGLDAQAFQISEDGAPLTGVVALREQSTSLVSPTLTVQRAAAPSGDATTLFSRGAALGIVWDAAVLRPDQQAVFDAGKQLLRAFLFNNSRAPGDPEKVSLFIPASSPDDVIQVPAFATYTQDGGKLINHILNTQQPRTKATNLYAAIQQAVVATAATGQREGRPAVVLVVSDGGDIISGDAFNPIVAQAQQQAVKIVALGVGSPQTLEKSGFRLSQLAAATGGIYVQQPTPDAMPALFAATMPAALDSMYSLRYSSVLVDDGKNHILALKVSANGVATNSQPIPFTPRVASTLTPLKPLGAVLLREYAAFAVPLALLAALVITMLTGGVRYLRDKSVSLHKAKTRH